MRIPVFSLAVLAAISAPVAAGPMTYSGSQSAEFVNPVGGTSVDGSNHSLFLGNYNQAAIQWAGASTFSATQGVPFNLGQISLWNGNPTNIPSQLTWQLNLNFAQPNTGLGSFNFATPLSYNSTNQKLTAAFTPGETASFTAANGTQFQLEILGLTCSPDWGGAVKGALVAPASEEKSDYVWGKLTQPLAVPSGTVDPVPQVPEPSALALGAIGLALVGFRRLRLRVVR